MSGPVSDLTRAYMADAFASTYAGGLTLLKPGGPVVVTPLGTKRGLIVVNENPYPCRTSAVGEEEDLGSVVRVNRRMMRCWWQGPERPAPDWLIDVTDAFGASLGRWEVEEVKDAETGEIRVEWEALLYQKVASTP